MRIGEEDTTKRKKVTITSSKKEKTKQKNKGKNKRKQQTFMSAYFSLDASVESRIIQSQEPKSAGEKMTRKKSERKFPLVFPVYAF